MHKVTKISVYVFVYYAQKQIRSDQIMHKNRSDQEVCKLWKKRNVKQAKQN